MTDGATKVQSPPWLIRPHRGRISSWLRYEGLRFFCRITRANTVAISVAMSGTLSIVGVVLGLLSVGEAIKVSLLVILVGVVLGGPGVSRSIEDVDGFNARVDMRLAMLRSISDTGRYEVMGQEVGVDDPDAPAIRGFVTRRRPTAVEVLVAIPGVMWFVAIYAGWSGWSRGALLAATLVGSLVVNPIARSRSRRRAAMSAPVPAPRLHPHPHDGADDAES